MNIGIYRPGSKWQFYNWISENTRKLFNFSPLHLCEKGDVVCYLMACWEESMKERMWDVLHRAGREGREYNLVFVNSLSVSHVLTHPRCWLKMNKTYPAALKTAFWSLWVFLGHPLFFISVPWYLKLILKFSHHQNIFHRHFPLLLIIAPRNKGIITEWLWPWLSTKKHCPRFGETPSAAPSSCTVNLQFSREDKTHSETVTSDWDYLGENTGESPTYNELFKG